jgi:putative flippase GtrA|tara:strand:+ start:2437 stop:2859 length:423 start_codon:yes stop_codon:yes gene_type:complete
MIEILKKYLLLYFSKQFIYFLFVGASAASLNFFSRFLFREFLDSLISAIFSYSFALVFAFFLHKRYVFPYSVVPIETQGIRFLAIQLACMPVVLIIFSQLSRIFYEVGLAGYAEPTAHIISIGTPALVTFLLYKLFVFYK